jgi:hypothetical protein
LKIKEASKELRKSKKLLKVIALIVHIGNFMNGGTNKAGAFGFKLGILLKLHETKTMDLKSSLLHYIVKLIKEKYQHDDLLSFMDDIRTVRDAQRGTTCLLLIASVQQ